MAIKDKVNVRNYGIVGFPAVSLQDIYTKSGPLANSSEFQVDYWALVFRSRFPDSSLLDIAVPLCFFNYPQEVNAARIDFEMKDVSELSSKLQPVALVQAEKILATSFKADLEAYFRCEFTPLLVPLNTIHKHPGGSASQSFSATDLDKNSKEHGVVFPWSKPETPDMPNFASIMALDSSICNLAHTEYRIVNGTLGVDIEYQKGRCLSFTINRRQVSAVEQLVNPAVSDMVVKLKESQGSMQQATADALFDLYNTLYKTYEPMTQFINPDNVKKKVYPAASSKHWWDDDSLTRYNKKETVHTIEALQAMSIFQLKMHLIDVTKYVTNTKISFVDLTEHDTKDVIADIQALYAAHTDEKNELIPFFKPVKTAAEKASSTVTYYSEAKLREFSLPALRAHLKFVAKQTMDEDYTQAELDAMDVETLIEFVKIYYSHSSKTLLPEKPTSDKSSKAVAATPSKQEMRAFLRDQGYNPKYLKGLSLEATKRWYQEELKHI